MKILKIFLRLKWKETIGYIDWEAIWKILLSAIIGAIGIMFTLFLLGLPGYYLFKMRPSDCKTVLDSIITSGFLLFVTGGILTLLVVYGIKFCKWICSNWKEAKRLAQEEISS